MKRYEVRLEPEMVQDLVKLAGKLTYETGVRVTWSSLIRRGVEMVIEAHHSVPTSGTEMSQAQ